MQHDRKERGGDCNIRFICHGAYVISSVFTEAIQWLRLNRSSRSKITSLSRFLCVKILWQGVA